MWEGSSGAIEHRVDIDSHHSVPLLRCEFGDVAKQADAGVVDHDVKPPERCDGELDQAFDLFGNGGPVTRLACQGKGPSLPPIPDAAPVTMATRPENRPTPRSVEAVINFLAGFAGVRPRRRS